MAREPASKGAAAFVDGQNLFHAAREAFSCVYPDYDPVKLALDVCAMRGWNLTQTRFYTGVPDAADNPFWNAFWSKKLLALSRSGVIVFSRSLRYRDRMIRLPDGTRHHFRIGEEKGIDVRIALDVIRLAHRREFDVALIFSQDQDPSEAADEIRQIAREQGRYIKVASAFPSGPASRNRRGIDKTDWIRIDRHTYDLCLDPRDYRG